MLRVKVALAYIVLVAILTGAAVGIIHAGVGDLAVSQTRFTLQQAAVGAEQSARLEEASLLARAKFVASSDRLYRSLQGEFVREKVAEGEEPADFEGERHIDADEKLKAQKYHLDDLEKSEAELPESMRSLMNRAPRDLDIFMVLDADGKGVAALGKDLYSWFGADVSKAQADVAAVAKGGEPRSGYWMWAFKPGEEKRLHRVALAPVRRTRDEAPAGVVVLGSIVNDGLAKRKQQLFTGGAEDVNAEFAFYHGADIVGSTFDTAQQKTVAGALSAANLTNGESSEITEVSVDGKPWLAVSHPLSKGEKPVGIAVLASVEAAQGPMAAMRVDVGLIGVVLLIFGGVLLVVVVHRTIKPVEQLEDGVQELIAGNKDYVWDPVKGNDLQSSLAQGLNMMSAYLQGKPMPDEDQLGGSWGDLMPNADAKPQGPGQVQGVDLAGLMGAKKPSNDGDA